MSDMNSVGRVIFDALVSRRSVVLPGVGVLEVRRRKAKKISETQIIPPQNVVTFSVDEEVEGAESIVAMLAASAGDSDMGAKSLYGAWFENAQTPDGGIYIENVGEIKDGRFVIAEPLHLALNPIEEEIVTMERERNNRDSLVAWILVGVLAALLVFGVLWCWKSGVFENICKKRTSSVETVVVPVAEPVYEEVVDVVPVDEEASGSGTAVSGPRFHVIAGSFAVEGNADKFIGKLKREYPELTLEKIVNPGSGYEMVSIFSATTEREAYNKMNLYWDIDLYLWVYQQK